MRNLDSEVIQIMISFFKNKMQERVKMSLKNLLKKKQENLNVIKMKKTVQFV